VHETILKKEETEAMWKNRQNYMFIKAWGKGT